MNQKEKLQEATMKALQGKILIEDVRLPQEAKDFLLSYEKQGFNEGQLEEIKQALIQRLPLEKIKIFADKKFDRGQMYVLRKAILYNLSQDEINFLANPKFSGEKMEQLALGFAHNLSQDEINFLANIKLNRSRDLKTIRELLEDGIFNEDQLKILFFKKGDHERDTILNIVRDQKIDNSILSYLINNSFDMQQLRVIENAIENNLSLEDIKTLGDINAPYDLMRQKLSQILKEPERTYKPRGLRQVDFDLANEITGIVKKYDKVAGTSTYIDKINPNETNFNYSIFTISPFTTQNYCSHGETNSKRLFNEVIKQGTALINELCDHFNVKATFKKSQDTHMSLADGNILGPEGGSVPIQGNYRISSTPELPMRVSFIYDISDNKKDDYKYDWNFQISTFKLSVKYKTYKK